MEEYLKQRFRELPSRSQSAIITLLSHAINHPEDHEVVVGNTGNKTRPYSFQVVAGGGRHIGPSVEDANNISQMLSNLEMVSFGLDGPRSFKFRPETLAFYREMHPLTEHERRVIIGSYFQKLGTGDDAMIPFNAEKLSTDLTLSAGEITETVQSLANAGYLHNVGPRGAKIPPYYQMTQLGFQWALSGFRADMLLTPSVTVNLHLAIEQTIEVIAELPISEEQRKAYELTAMKLERELNAGKVSWSTIKDALGMAADAAALAPHIISVLASHQDQILRAATQVI